MGNYENQAYCNEISLINYINILIRRKVAFLTPVFVSILMAIAIYKNAPVIFEQSAVARIGSFSRPVMTVHYAIWFIRNQSSLKSTIEKHKLLVDIEELKSMFNSSQIKTVGIDDRFLKITVTSSSLEKSRSIAEALVNDFVDRGNELFLRKKQFLESQLKACQDSDEIIKSNPFVYQVGMNNMLLVNEELLNSENFEVIEPPSPAEGRKTKQNTRIMVILMSGVFLGIVLAFFQEFWVNNFRKRAK